MKEKILLIIKGFIMGIANIIPGVSGGTLAIILGIYEDFIGALSHIFSNLKKNLAFLIPIGIGILISVATMSNLIDYSYSHFPLPTTIFFVGLVIGGVPLLLSKVKGKKDSKKIVNYSIFVFTFCLVIFMSCADIIFEGVGSVSFSNMSFIKYVLLFLVGIIAAGTMVIPGISGSLVLMLLGYYYPVIKLIKSLVHFENVFHNFILLFIFGLGIVVGMILISKLFEFLFKKYETTTYYGVLGFIFSSIIAIPLTSLRGIKLSLGFGNISCCILFLIIGILISYKLGEK